MLKIGTDIVQISRIKLDEFALKKIFHDSELEDSRPAHIAGMIAAKESVIKALDGKIGFLDIALRYVDHKPYADVSVDTGIKNIELTISHDGDYAIAFALIELI